MPFAFPDGSATFYLQRAPVGRKGHYDPWGLNLVGIERQGAPDHKFQYNGKGKQSELGLNWHDYGARMYDAQLGRWHVVDPLAENYYDVSSYIYALNNPIIYVDPDGRDVYVIIDGRAVLTKKQDGDHRFYDNNSGDEINPFGKDWSYVASALNEAGNDVVSGLGDSDQAKALRKNVGLYNSMQVKNFFNDNADLITGLGGIRIALTKGYSWLLRSLSDDAAELVINKSVGAAAKGFSKRFLTADELARRLGTSVSDFHDNIKGIMKKDFAKEMQKIGTTNPDIGVDDLGNIILKNPKTGKTIPTNVPLEAYKLD